MLFKRSLFSKSGRPNVSWDEWAKFYEKQVDRRLGALLGMDLEDSDYSDHTSDATIDEKINSRFAVAVSKMQNYDIKGDGMSSKKIPRLQNSEPGTLVID